MSDVKFLNIPGDLESKKKSILLEAEKFLKEFKILESDNIHILIDGKTNAFYCECHICAKDLIEKGTIDVPLDPETQPDYRANREANPEHAAYLSMVEDALSKRAFSNIVCEYNYHYEKNKPIKIIGGQHRFLAIESALREGVNEYHGVKIYFDLDKTQRLDVQLISNTNIPVSTDLLDRMFETSKGPELRDWCQRVGLLKSGEDFSDKKQRGSKMSVRGARTFILNFYLGKEVKDKDFDKTETLPIIAKTGTLDQEWEKLRQNKAIWKDKDLEIAAKEFSKLNASQNKFFQGKKNENIEYSEKAVSYSVLSAWAFTAGVLHKNKVRLQRHFELSQATGSDPLQAVLLSKAKHKSDPENYRGLGTRTDAKDRGRLAELFFLQADKGGGITKSLIDVAIKKYHAKLSQLEVIEAEKKL